MPSAPSDWRETTIRRAMRRLDRPAQRGLDVVTAYRDGAVTLRSNRREEGYTFSDTEDGYQEIRPGDLVFHALDGFAGATGVSDSHGNASPVYHVCEPTDGNDPKFLARLLRHLGTSGFLTTQAPNVRERSVDFRNWNTFARIPLVLPPPAEQRAIADYLDQETAQIDTLIAKQEQLIATLRERRTAMIRRVVPIADAEGQISDKLGRRSRIGNGSTPRRENTTYWEGGSFPWLNSAVVNQRRVTDSAQFVTEAALRACHLPVVKPGSVLVGLTGQGKTRGMATLLETEATISQHVAYITPDYRHWSSNFLLWSLTAAYGDLRRLSDENGSTKGGLTCDDLKRFRLAMPPLEEQNRIAVYLDEQTTKIDALIAKTERFIELAKERRTSLITAAVTGQIEVRAPA